MIFYGYPMPVRPGLLAQCRLESHAAPPGGQNQARVATALFAPSFATAKRCSSVSATYRPPMRSLPFLDIKSGRLRRLAHAAPNPLMASIWPTHTDSAPTCRIGLQWTRPAWKTSCRFSVSVYVCHIYVI